MPPDSSLFGSYPAADDSFDELFDASGQARAHWQPLLEHITGLHSQTLDARHRAVTRMLRENGVTYNVYADPAGPSRAWDLDLLPFIVPAAEWAGIESAVAQRAILLNRILADLYGEQTLVRDGRLPAALVHAHPGFLRPCHGIGQNADQPLVVYAADLARSPDGRWWVLRDRTQGPTGVGYALENRMAITRAFPELFRDLSIERLAGFLATLRDGLAARAPRTDASQAVKRLGHDAHAGGPDDSPLVVLLTAGPYSETYSEQAFLARYLGFPLVVGGDLTVRQGFVWLKTLSGLQRVSVILRRLDDDYCDPLELRADSALGVPGLTEAARRGHVVIANGLGSGILESGAMLGYLPVLCQALLGESLRLPSVATWWCGEPAALEDVIGRLDQVVIKPAFPRYGEPPVFGQDLDAAARARLIDRLRSHPQNFLAQESVRLSRAPVWQPANPAPAGWRRDDSRTLRAAAVGLRVFACAMPDGRYAVMPGGLARVASGSDTRIISMQEGGGAKDTWVLSDGHVSQGGLQPAEAAVVHAIRGDDRQSSRTVENLYWFGRYCERVDNAVRLLRRTLDTMLGASPGQRGADWRTLIELCRWSGLVDEAVRADDPKIQARLLAAVFSARPGAVPRLVQALYDVSSRLHERLSLDNWRVLNQMVQTLGAERSNGSVDAAMQRLDAIIIAVMSLSGFALDGMTRDLGWRFLSLGRRIERFVYMARVLKTSLDEQQGGEGLEWLLEVGDSIATYRARYVAAARWPLVLDLLLIDETNPRSIVFQLDGMIKSARQIAPFDKGMALDTLLPLREDLKALRGNDRLRRDSVDLLAWLDRAATTGARLSDEVCSRCFSYSGRGALAVAA